MYKISHLKQFNPTLAQNRFIFPIFFFFFFFFTASTAIHSKTSISHSRKKKLPFALSEIVSTTPSFFSSGERQHSVVLGPPLYGSGEYRSFRSSYIILSLVDESPVNSSSSDDFAAFLDAELDSTSDTNPQQEEEKQESDDDDADDNDDEINAVIERTKRRKISVVDDTEEPNGFNISYNSNRKTSVKVDICIHPGFIGGMCIKCGEKTDDDTQSSVAFGYIHKDLRLANDEIARLRDRDLKKFATP
ncbi:putative protein-serine/threonine phosphatase [Helianthus annuus]|nr:putative protein-serine/threonine phosphatase [Helianthus annuus]